jgi:hypothetical protein
MYQFTALNKENQAETVWKGHFIMKRDEGDYTVILYKIDTFFVEVYYTAANQINSLTPFLSFANTEPYFKVQLS